MSSLDFLYRKKIQEEKCKIEISHQKDSNLKIQQVLRMAVLYRRNFYLEESPKDVAKCPFPTAGQYRQEEGKCQPPHQKRNCQEDISDIWGPCSSCTQDIRNPKVKEFQSLEACQAFATLSGIPMDSRVMPVTTATLEDSCGQLWWHLHSARSSVVWGYICFYLNSKGFSREPWDSVKQLFQGCSFL